MISELDSQGEGDAVGTDAVDVSHKLVSENAPYSDSQNDQSTTAQMPEGLLDTHDPKVIRAIEQSVTIPLQKAASSNDNHQTTSQSQDANFSDRTQPMARGITPTNREASIQVAVGVGRSSGRSPASPAGQQSQAALEQAAILDLAQSRINELTLEKERLEEEVRLLVSAGSIAKRQEDEMKSKLYESERVKNDVLATAELETKILKESLMDKDRELIRLKKKLDEMDGQMHTDLKKVRVRERKLEHQLEMSRLEKVALVRSKDETILDLKRKLDDYTSHLELEKHKAADLQKKIEQQQDQLGRTVRALRMALTNLESTDSTSGQLVPIKKAE